MLFKLKLQHQNSFSATELEFKRARILEVCTATDA